MWLPAVKVVGAIVVGWWPTWAYNGGLLLAVVLLLGSGIAVGFNALLRRMFRTDSSPSSSVAAATRFVVQGGVWFLVAVLGWTAWHHGEHESDLGPPRRIAMPAGSIYLALGDSFSAGEGLPPYRPGSGDAPKACHQSANAYARRMRFSPPRLPDFRACSGARLADIKAGVTNLRRAHHGHTQLDKPPAADRVGLITITISGNDMEFSEVLKHCAWESHCVKKSASFTNGVPVSTWARTRLSAIGEGLDALFKGLRSDFPEARIIVMGYPDLFAENGSSLGGADLACAFVGSRWAADERRDLLRIETALNDRIRARAVAHQLEYVSMESTFLLHEPCGRSGEWVRFVSTNLRSGLGDIRRLADPGIFHPTSAGQSAMARMIACEFLVHRARVRRIPGGPPITLAGPSSIPGTRGDLSFTRCVHSG